MVAAAAEQLGRRLGSAAGKPDLTAQPIEILHLREAAAALHVGGLAAVSRGDCERRRIAAATES